MGIYITNAVKTPKSDYTVERSSIENSLPYLEKELALFSNVKVVMLMGDVAKKPLICWRRKFEMVSEDIAVMARFLQQ